MKIKKRTRFTLELSEEDVSIIKDALEGAYTVCNQESIAQKWFDYRAEQYSGLSTELHAKGVR